jgi:hypothetical protein
MTNKRHDKVDMSSRRGVYRCTGRQRGRREIEEEKRFMGGRVGGIVRRREGRNISI